MRKVKRFQREKKLRKCKICGENAIQIMKWNKKKRRREIYTNESEQIGITFFSFRRKKTVLECEELKWWRML